MATPLEVLKRLERSIAEGHDGEKRKVELLPPLTDDEFRRLRAQVPCAIPEEARECFQYARGFKLQNALLHGGDRSLSTVDLCGLDAQFGLAQIFPNAVSIADDSCGNFWVVDLTSDAKSWGPIFYACHDAPVVVYQTDSLADFMEQVVKGSSPQSRSELEAVYEEFATQIWLRNPGILNFDECAGSKDEDLRIFARSLDESYEFIDLRTPKLGDGFSWGRYGPGTVNKRFGEKRIFACQKKTKWERFKQFWKR